MDEANGSEYAGLGGGSRGGAALPGSGQPSRQCLIPAGAAPITGEEEDRVWSSASWPGGLAVADQLSGLVDALGEVAAATTEAGAVDWIAGLEELKAACAAAQALQTEALYSLRCADEADQGVPAAERGRGVAAEVALARRESPARGSRELGVARALMDDLPCTREALRRGAISEYKASLMVKETSWLPGPQRRQVDALMAERLAELGNHRLAGEARAHAQRLDPAAAVKHTDRALTERRVSVRPAPGGMAYLTALLPMKQAVACLANLQRTAATTVGTGQGAERTQDQVMADLLVERVTGQQSADDVPVEVHLVMTDRTLLGADAQPGWLVGHGPVPAGTARRTVRDTEAEVFLRRLYTDPDTGQLVGMDSRKREFTGMLRRMVILREDTCRTPWCDAPVKHLDHAIPARDGGPTSFENASGLCARCNYTKEYPGWTHHGTPEALEVTTPTGHHYHQPTGPLLPAAPPAPAAPPGLTDLPEPTEPPGARSTGTKPPGRTSPDSKPSGARSPGFQPAKPAAMPGATAPPRPGEPADRRGTAGRALPIPVVIFPPGKPNPHWGRPIPMEAADIKLPPRPPEDQAVPVPAGISLPEAHLALYLAAV